MQFLQETEKKWHDESWQVTNKTHYRMTSVEEKHLTEHCIKIQQIYIEREKKRIKEPLPH